MPAILDRLVRQLEARGLPKGEAFAIATKQQQRAGNLKRGTQELTPKGARRQAMGNEGRAKERASRHSAHSMDDYTYDPKTNRATLRKS